MNYKIGDHLATKNGKMTIANDKKRLIKLAQEEIAEWQETRDGAERVLAKWIRFLKKAQESK